MTIAVNIADTVDPKDPRGRTFREINRATPHNIPVGFLVELYNHTRAFVVAHFRDCDETPIYSLAMDDYPYQPGGQIATGLNHGWSEDLLTPLHPGPRLWNRIEAEMLDGKREEMTQDRWESQWLQQWPERR